MCAGRSGGVSISRCFGGTVNHHGNLREARWYDRGDNGSSCKTWKAGGSVYIPVAAGRCVGGDVVVVVVVDMKF